MSDWQVALLIASWAVLCAGAFMVFWMGHMAASAARGALRSNRAPARDEPIKVAFRLTDSRGPVPGARMWITSDVGGRNAIVPNQRTDSAGLVSFVLDANVTYYCWIDKKGVHLDDPLVFRADSARLGAGDGLSIRRN